MAWMDNTGLYQKYGLEQVTSQVAGEYVTDGSQRMIELKLDLTTLTSTAGTIISGTDSVFFPAGFTIDKIEVFTETPATSGGSATLDLGLVRSSDRTTEIDNNGLLAAVAVASMSAAGETVVYANGVSGAGALVGTTVGSNPGHLTANYGTAAFTAGVAVIRIYYHKP
jgi:hypothetical protein